MNTARDILNRLTALGARVERSGDRVVLCAGRRPVPGELLEQARAVKPELMHLLTAKALSTPEGAQAETMSILGVHEHLRPNEASPANSPKAPKTPEDAHERTLSIFAENEHLRATALSNADVALAPPSPTPAETTPEAQAHAWYSPEAGVAALAADTGLTPEQLAQRDWPASAWRRLHHAKGKFWAAPRRDAFGNASRYIGPTAEILAFSDLCDTWRRKHMATETNGAVAREGAARALAGFGIKAPPGWEP